MSGKIKLFATHFFETLCYLTSMGLILILGNFWLGLFVVFILTLFVVFALYSKSRIIRFNRIVYLVFLLFELVFRLLYIEVFYVPSNSMEKTLTIGDFIFVSKISKDYRTEIKRSSVIVFYSNEQKVSLVKRCVAISGDTVSVRNGRVVIGQYEERERLSFMKYCKIELLSTAFPTTFLEEFGIQYRPFLMQFTGVTDVFSTFISNQQIMRISRDIRVKHIEIDPCRPDTAYTFYPNKPQVQWNLDNWGPMIMPIGRRSLDLDSLNVLVYQDIIQKFEMKKNDILFDSNRFMGHLPTIYSFENSYCFVMGDNRYNSRDSRYIGPIPYKDVIGTVVCVLFSFAPDKVWYKAFRWDRFLKIVE